MRDLHLNTKAMSVMPWVFSLVFHGTLVVTIGLAVWRQDTAIETQEQVFIEKEILAQRLRRGQAVPGDDVPDRR